MFHHWSDLQDRDHAEVDRAKFQGAKTQALNLITSEKAKAFNDILNTIKFFKLADVPNK